MRTPMLLDAGDLRQQIGARQAIGRDAEMQHAAGQRAGLADLDLMAESGQVIGGRQPARAGADHQDPPAGGGRRPEPSSVPPSPCRQESARPCGSTPRSPFPRGCRPFRTDDSRPGHGSPAADCPPSAFPTRGGNRRPAPAPARPGCFRRRGRRDCREAAVPRSWGSACGMAPRRDVGSDRPPGSDRAPAAPSFAGILSMSGICTRCR